MRLFDRAMLIVFALMLAAVLAACEAGPPPPPLKDRVRAYCEEMLLTPKAIVCVQRDGFYQCDVHTVESGLVPLTCGRHRCRVGSR